MRTGRLGVTGIRVCCLTIGLMFSLSVGLSAQSRQGRTSTNAANAVLHIQVNVVPTVLSHRPQPQTTSSSSISYIIPTVTYQSQTIVQEAQLTAQSGNCASAVCSGILRTTTIVAH